MSRPVLLCLLLVLALLATLATATGLGWNSTARELVRIGNVEVRIPDAERWWTQAARCLGDPTPYNPHTRWFVGSAIPRGLDERGGAAVSSTTALNTPASTTGVSSARIPSGTAPTSPVSGDIWYDGTNLKFRDGVTTRTITWT